MSKLLIALGIVLAAGLSGCESMGGKNPSGERYDERKGRR